MRRQALALLSSGLDSAVALAMTLKQGTEIGSCLTIDYGQRAAYREQEQARRIAAHFGLKHEVLRLSWFDSFKKQGLLDTKAPLPKPETQQLDEAGFTEKSAAAVWVPNRNGVFLEVAASIAEERGWNEVIVGFNAEEAATFPDNSALYLDAINKSLAFSTNGRVKVVSPTIAMTKTEIVGEAKSLEFPIELLWSCYENESKMCGRCESCMRLKRALNRNGVEFGSLFIDTSL